jgi:hypothetical protein
LCHVQRYPPELEARIWAIPAGKMKMKRPHRVPLAPQAVTILRELRTITGRGKFLFPSIRSTARRMSENTINAALRLLGFKKDEMTAHCFRSAASSMLNESGLWNADAIERQLAHVDNDSVRRAYARADFWEERVRMMEWWADRCDKMRRGACSGVPSVNCRRFAGSRGFLRDLPEQRDELAAFTVLRLDHASSSQRLSCTLRHGLRRGTRARGVI